MYFGMLVHFGSLVFYWCTILHFRFEISKIEHPGDDSAGKASDLSQVNAQPDEDMPVGSVVLPKLGTPSNQVSNALWLNNVTCYQRKSLGL